jgi:hypothetical protein
MNGIKLSSEIEDSGKIQRHSGAIHKRYKKVQGDKGRFREILQKRF